MVFLNIGSRFILQDLNAPAKRHFWISALLWPVYYFCNQHIMLMKQFINEVLPFFKNSVVVNIVNLLAELFFF